jgi:hypothetical protein
LGDLDSRYPGVDFFQRRWSCLTAQCFNQFSKSERAAAVKRFGGTGSFGIELCREKWAPSGILGLKSYISLDRRESRTRNRGWCIKFGPSLCSLRVSEPPWFSGLNEKVTTEAQRHRC